jgi:uncharacterized iron-regulated membrane protein
MMSWRKIHRYVALVILLPLTLISLTGVVLQLRSQFEFIQPSTIKNEMPKDSKLMSFESLLETYGAKNIEQIILKPSKGSLVVRLLDGHELQLNPVTGEVLKKALRRTNFLIELHQGSFFGKFGQYGVFFLAALGLCFLIVSGMIIYPFKRKRV